MISQLSCYGTTKKAIPSSLFSDDRKSSQRAIIERRKWFPWSWEAYQWGFVGIGPSCSGPKPARPKKKILKLIIIIIINCHANLSFTRIFLQSVTLCLCLEDLGSDALHGLLDWKGVFWIDECSTTTEDREGGGKKSDTQVTLDRCNGCCGSLCCGWHTRQAAACGSHSQITNYFSHTVQTVQTLTPKMKVGAEKSIYYLGQKNRYNREIHEADLQFDHMISCDIELRFDIDATRGLCALRARVADRSRCRMISDDRTADQSHEYLGCNDFFGQGSNWVLGAC